MTSKWKTGWKLVRKNGLRNESSWFAAETVYYSKHRTTERPSGCGPLAVFDTRAHARAQKRLLINDAYNTSQIKKELVIHKCRYIPSADKSVWKRCYNLPNSTDKVIVGLNTSMKVEVDGSHQLMLYLPDGTILADKVRLI